MGRKRGILLAICAACLAVFSCATDPTVKDPDVQPADLAGYTTWTTVNAVPLTGDRFSVLGQAHGGADGIREIYIGDVGTAVSAAGAGFPYPVGTVIVMETYERAASGGKGAVAQIAGMVKRAPGYNPAAGSWEYLLLKPDLTLGARGQLAACIACHAAASDRDHVFNNGRTTVK